MQFLNAPSFIFLTEDGISMDNKFWLFSIRYSEIFVNFRFVGNLICAKQEFLNCPLLNFSVVG